MLRDSGSADIRPLLIIAGGADIHSLGGSGDIGRKRIVRYDTSPDGGGKRRKFRSDGFRQDQNVSAIVLHRSGNDQMGLCLKNMG